MKSGHRRLSVLVLTVAGMLLAGSAPAAWYMAQGNFFSFENPGNLLNADVHVGWGLHNWLVANSGTWVQMPIPSATPGAGARRVKIQFEVGPDVTVVAVHVYNGADKVNEFTGLSYTGSQTVVFNLGSVKQFNRGMSICMQVLSGSSANNDDHFVIVYSAGANFVN
jgi:hypothetical protein